MQFSFLLAVLAALVIAENSPTEPVGAVGWRLGLAGAGVAAVALAAGVLSLSTAFAVRRHVDRRRTIVARMARWRRVHTVLWIAVGAGICLGLGWPQIVRFNWGMERLLLVDELLILLPVLLPMVLSWVAFYQVERAFYEAGSAGEEDGPAPDLLNYLAVHCRHYLGVMLVPILVLLGMQDAVALWLPGLMESRWSFVVYLLPIGVLIFFFPSLLRRLWKTQPLAEGPLREQLLQAAGRAGFKLREILVWETGGMIVNAAVSGWLPGRRYVFLTDGLIDRLTADEIEGVFAHELGHLRHRHLTRRGLVMLAPLGVLLAIEQWQPALLSQFELQLKEWGLAAQLPLSLAVLTALAAYAYFVFGGYSRLLECQADLYACRLLEQRLGDEAAGVYASALEKLAVASGVNRRQATWQHPSIVRRVEAVCGR